MGTSCSDRYGNRYPYYVPEETKLGLVSKKAAPISKGFLRLPAEIRHEIYQYYFRGNHVIDITLGTRVLEDGIVTVTSPQQFRTTRSLSFALLSTSSVVYNEASQYSRKTEWSLHIHDCAIEETVPMAWVMTKAFPTWLYSTIKSMHVDLCQFMAFARHLHTLAEQNNAEDEVDNQALHLMTALSLDLFENLESCHLEFQLPRPFSSDSNSRRQMSAAAICLRHLFDTRSLLLSISGHDRFFSDGQRCGVLVRAVVEPKLPINTSTHRFKCRLWRHSRECRYLTDEGFWDSWTLYERSELVDAEDSRIHAVALDQPCESGPSNIPSVGVLADEVLNTLRLGASS